MNCCFELLSCSQRNIDYLSLSLSLESSDPYKRDNCSTTKQHSHPAREVFGQKDFCSSSYQILMQFIIRSIIISVSFLIPVFALQLRERMLLRNSFQYLGSEGIRSALCSQMAQKSKTCVCEYVFTRLCKLLLPYLSVGIRRRKKG